MEKKPRDLTELQPTKETRINGFLNGLLNGITIGSAPLGFFSLRRVFTGHEIPGHWMKISAALSVIGGAIGALFGIREGERLVAFRSAVVRNVQSLSDDVEELKELHEKDFATMKALQEKDTAPVTTPEWEGTVKETPAKTQETTLS